MNTMTQARPASNAMGLVLMLAAAGLLLSGGYALMQLLTTGHAAFNGDSRGLYWGLPIVTYDFFLLSSTGLTLLASLWTVFGLKDFEPIARRAQWLAVAALVGGVAALFMELGAPLRAMLLIPTSFATSAPLFWKVWGVIFYVVALAILVVKWLAVPGAQPPRGAAVAACVAAVFVTFAAGTVFGMMAMRPFWFGGEMALAFSVESLLGAVTFIIIFTHLAHGFDANRLDARTRTLLAGPLAGLFGALMVAHALFVLTRLIAGLGSNADGLQVWQYLWSRPMFQAELWLGLGIPLLITLSPSTRQSLQLQLLAAVIAVLALFVARYDFVVGGQMVPLFKGSWAPGLLSYSPSLTEWAVLAAAVFLSNLVNALGEKRLALDGPAA